MNGTMAAAAKPGPGDSAAAASAAAARGSAVLLAGGGTGGHISPGLAIAERLRAIAPAVRPIFACSERPIDAAMLSEAGATFVPIPAQPFSMRPIGLLRFLRSWRRGRAVCNRLLRDHEVRWVVALGGFVTPPVVAAARAAGIPVLLMNLDATPGRANRWVAKRASKVLSAVPTPGLSGFAERIVGMPIRRIALAPGDPLTCREQLGLRPTMPTLLVTGASQGAASLNELVMTLVRRRPELLAGWQVLHLCGQADPEPIRAAYRAAGVPALVEQFLHRMGLAWGSADLALSRAGANSVAEAAANAVPTIFAPYPYHKDLHQEHNARPLVSLGAAAMARDLIDPDANAAAAVEGTAPTLGSLLVELLTDPAQRRAMRDRLLARPAEDAATVIARELVGADAVPPEGPRG
jgi:UDP-N-acetylglucosamine--N-acetylmuramyl-(pentapeptide) pyrophosphoryl-undecaprenol N-acetylglucosamine transferase